MKPGYACKLQEISFYIYIVSGLKTCDTTKAELSDDSLVSTPLPSELYKAMLMYSVITGINNNTVSGLHNTAESDSNSMVPAAPDIFDSNSALDHLIYIFQCIELLNLKQLHKKLQQIKAKSFVRTIFL
jgi:hypothetical protein